LKKKVTSPPTVLSIPYTKFLALRLRTAASKYLELDARKRQFRLFTLDNDAIGCHVRGAGAYEPEVLAAIAAIAGTSMDGVALDIGANIGNHTIILSRCFARVLAFEPNPMLASVLDANLRLNGCTNVKIVKRGLSDRRVHGHLKQRQVGNSGTFEFIESVGKTDSDDDLRHTGVELARGDEILMSVLAPPERIRIIKIDIEGGELAALRGLEAHLKRDMPIVCFEVRNAAEGEPVREFLETVGYSHFTSVGATRLSMRSIAKMLVPSTWSKHYRLTSIKHFENRHYPAIFASAAPVP